jgi:hypothetical protein
MARWSSASTTHGDPQRAQVCPISTLCAGSEAVKRMLAQDNKFHQGNGDDGKHYLAHASRDLR